jgi:hypothetical protein
MNLIKSLLNLRTRPRLYLVFPKVDSICLSKMSSTDAATPWHAAYPSPLSKTPSAMTRQEVLNMIKDSRNIAGKDYVLVDLRRADHEVAPTFHIFGDNN